MKIASQTCSSEGGGGGGGVITFSRSYNFLEVLVFEFTTSDFLLDFFLSFIANAYCNCRSE